MSKPILLKLLTPVILVVIILSFFRLVLPWYKKVRTLSSEVAQKSQRVEKLEQKAGTLKGLDEEELSEKVKIVLKALPADKNVFQAIGVVNRLVQETGVVVGSFSVSPGEVTQDNLSAATLEDKLSFKLQLIGEDSQLQDFLKKINQFLPLTAVKKASFTSGEVEETTLTFDLYFSPLPASLGKIDEPLALLNAEEEKFLAKISHFPYYAPERIFYSGEVPSGRVNPFAF